MTGELIALKCSCDCEKFLIVRDGGKVDLRCSNKKCGRWIDYFLDDNGKRVPITLTVGEPSDAG